jgi:2-octaprenylphenol hydroxylase
MMKFNTALAAKSKEILVKGGGLVGLAAALALLKLGFDVTVLEKSPVNLLLDNQETYDLRVSSITPLSVKIFKSLDIWEKMQKLRVSPFEAIKVWEENPENALIFEGKTIGEIPLGYIVENSVIKKLLLEALRASIFQTDFEDSEKRILNAALVIAADGADSEVRKKAGITCEIKNYHQQAVVAHIKTSKSHQRIARQRFLPTGPLGFLPLHDTHLCSIVWSHQETAAKNLAAMSESEFNQALHEAFGNELGELHVISRRITFPLRMQAAAQYVKPGIALIGDAAHTLHPLAGYGLNMGFLDAVTLAHILKEAKNQQRDIGKLHTLRKYERARKSENLLMLKAIDSFTLPSLRGIGIDITRKSSLLRNFFMQWMSRHGQENIFI